jgi:hypothetical protein
MLCVTKMAVITIAQIFPGPSLSLRRQRPPAPVMWASVTMFRMVSFRSLRTGKAKGLKGDATTNIFLRFITPQRAEACARRISETISICNLAACSVNDRAEDRASVSRDDDDDDDESNPSSSSSTEKVCVCDSVCCVCVRAPVTLSI